MAPEIVFAAKFKVELAQSGELLDKTGGLGVGFAATVTVWLTAAQPVVPSLTLTVYVPAEFTEFVKVVTELDQE